MDGGLNPRSLGFASKQMGTTRSLPHRVVGRLREVGASGPGAAEQSRKCQGVLFCDGEKTLSLGDSALSGLGLHRISVGCVLMGSGQGSPSAQEDQEPGGGSAPTLGSQGDPGSRPPPPGTFLVHVRVLPVLPST